MGKKNAEFLFLHLGVQHTAFLQIILEINMHHVYTFYWQDISREKKVEKGNRKTEPSSKDCPCPLTSHNVSDTTKKMDHPRAWAPGIRSISGTHSQVFVFRQ